MEKIDRLNLGKELIGVLKGFLEFSSSLTTNEVDDLVSKIPFGKIISFVTTSKKILTKIRDEKEALRAALILSSLRSLEETLIKFDVTPDKTSKILNEVRNRIENNLNGFLSELSPESFDPEDLKSVNSDIFNEIASVFLEPIRNHDYVSFDNFKREFKWNLIINFWLVLEQDSDKFEILINYLNSKSYHEKKTWWRLRNYLLKEADKFKNEPIFGNELGVTLSDVFIAPEFRIYHHNVKKDENKKGENKEKEKFTTDEEFFWLGEQSKGEFLLPKSERQLQDLVYSFLKGEKLEYLKPERPKVLLLLGYPGEGKSSFCLKTIVDYVAGNLELDRELYYLELKKLKVDTRNPLGKIRGKIKEEIGIETDPPDFKNSVLILDGLDELQIIEGFRDADKFLEHLIGEISRQDLDIRILITSRYGYVNLKELHRKYNDLLLITELRGFTKEKVKDWIGNYSRFDKGKSKFLEKTEEVWKEKNKYRHLIEILAQPVLLYMIVAADIDLLSITKRGEIYRKLIKFVVERKWGKVHEILRGLRPEVLSDALQEMAFLMFRNGRPFLKADEISESPSAQKLYTRLMDNKKSEPEEILKGLLIAFYFRELKEGGDYAIEFYHKSIQEYLTAKYICRRMFEFLDESDECAMEMVWDIFSFRPISEEIRGYLTEVIEEKGLEKREMLAEKLTSVLEKLLEIDFLVKPKELEGQEFPLYRPLIIFRNFWIFAKSLVKEFSYLDKLKNLRKNFIHLLIYVQVDVKTFIKEFPLYSENLRGEDFNEANLEGANLKRANLEGANLKRANLWGANLERANLERANLTETSLVWANLVGANLERANLWGADLRTIVRFNTIIDTKFNIEEIKKARNWDKAIYDYDQKEKLGLK